jgi:hypothetical protein
MRKKKVKKRDGCELVGILNRFWTNNKDKEEKP